MSQCIKCGTRFVGTPENPPKPGLCRYCERDELRAKVKALEAERDSLQQWVHDCQAGMYVNCVYCGHRYGPDDEVPAAMADALKEHIEICQKHPIKCQQLEAQVQKLREALAKLEDFATHQVSGQQRPTLGGIAGWGVEYVGVDPSDYAPIREARAALAEVEQ